MEELKGKELERFVESLKDDFIKEFLQYPESYSRYIGKEIYPLLEKEAEKRKLEIKLQESSE